MNSPIRLILKWAGPDRKYLIAAVVFAFVSGLMAMVPYYGVYEIMKAAYEGTCTWEVITSNALVVAVGVCIQYACFGCAGALSHKGAYNTLFRVRCRVVDHLAHAPLGQLDERSTGSIKTVLSDDIEKLELFLAHNITEAIMYLTGPVAAFIFLCSVNVPLALATLVPFAAAFVVMGVIFKRMAGVMPRASAALSRMNAVMVEYVRGMRVIKALNMGSKSFRRFQSAVDEEHAVWCDIARKTGPGFAAFVIIIECGMLVMVPLGGFLFSTGAISGSTFLLFAFVGSLYLTEIRLLQEIGSKFAQVKSGAIKAQELLDLPAFAGGAPFPAKSDVRLENVRFSYDGTREVLHGVTLAVQQGERLAVVGPSGAGKTTIVELGSRFYDATEGTVRIGGVDVRDLDYDDLLAHVAVVFQKTFLTSGSILENIRMGKRATLDEVREAARQARIDDFIMGLPRDYDTEIGTLGERLSGGQRPRHPQGRARAHPRRGHQRGRPREPGADRRGHRQPLRGPHGGHRGASPGRGAHLRPRGRGGGRRHLGRGDARRGACRVPVLPQGMGGLRADAPRHVRVRRRGGGSGAAAARRKRFRPPCRRAAAGRIVGARASALEPDPGSGPGPGLRLRLDLGVREEPRLLRLGGVHRHRGTAVGLQLRPHLPGDAAGVQRRGRLRHPAGIHRRPCARVRAAAPHLRLRLRARADRRGAGQPQPAPVPGRQDQAHPLARFTERSSGDYLNALTANVNDYEQILTHRTGSVVKDITLAVMLTGFVCWLYLPAGAVVALSFALIVPAMALSWHQVRRYGTRKSDICAANTSRTVEHVTGMQTLRAYGIGGVKNEAIVDSMREYSDVSFWYEAALIPLGAVMSIIVGLCQPLLFLMCGAAYLDGALGAVPYLLIIMLPLFMNKVWNSIFVNLTAYKNLMIAKRRIQAVVDEPEEAGSFDALPATGSRIELADVGFAYCKGEPVFEGLRLTCEDGKLTALVGDSGCGKSTALNLIAQYYRPARGTVRIGGADTAAYAPESVLAGVSVVDQNVFLFDDSVMDNIRYARPGATDDEVREACRLANADGFVRALPEGYASRIGENGGRLSGGERQRLSIARAILRDAPIVLLDEATASLDIENELAVKEAIANLLAKRKTVVMVAHTLAIVRGADSIAVVGDGRVLEQGTHDELVAAGGKYARMWAADRELA